MARSKSSQRIALILDVESGLARASIVNLSARDPDILYVNEKTFSVKSLNRVVPVALSALKESLVEVTKHYALHRQNTSRKSVPISEVHIVLSSPWILSQAHTISHTFKKPRVITPKIITTILDKNDPKPKTHIAFDEESIDRTVIDVFLNGYSVPEWNGKEASQVEVTCIASMASKALLKEFRYMCSHLVPESDIHFHSSLVLQYRHSLSFAQHDIDHICVNVHDEVTDIICINKQQGISFGSFPIGHRTLERRVMGALSLKSNLSGSALSLHSSLALDHIHSREIIKALERVMSGWKNEYSEFVKVASPESQMPAYIYVSSDEFQGLFWRAIKALRPKAKVEHGNAIHTYCEAIKMI